ncbi:bacterial transcriptional activator domain-containing protein [Mycolicibacterium fortuitum]|uniref:Uncharacterized protein n=2 Tax=Mycolicibacterium fortuitum TaxID=1766 RepID=A0AAE4VIK4_MYCFO|nr:bacterial transcriptional activator domain-containing protein [Mycolicibacterium fortuitum]MCV7144257.1 hypothetical protein [Mycolicibacterium fortuitum]MDV7195353.1 hypothetical protein [Mycolicibacterium fortuitum]MDV7209062.1 hypothetical protein [Mycolicibacterium fortuitum]MDV7230896.1 hypothetical protein [Mycolicibacterium fortuitum]MDV7262467.1 hypothetical protein [Mycolicibacterium fortuitum]
MNEQAAKLTRWLLAGNGALKNIAQLLTDAFGPTGAVAAAIDASTLTAYPADPSAEPKEQGWTQVAQGWTYPLHSQLLPRATTAHHHIVVGITSRNEVLVVNLAAADYLGIEAANPTLMMRSWLMQTLSKTPAAHVAVTDPALAIPGAERLILIDDPAATPPDTSLLFSTVHTSAPIAGQPHPITVSSEAVNASNVVLCNEAVAGIYLADRYWPIWRRMEVADSQWDQLKAVLSPPPAAATTPAGPAPEAIDEPDDDVAKESPASTDGPKRPGGDLQDPASTLVNETEPAPTATEEPLMTSADSTSPDPELVAPAPPTIAKENALTSGNDTSPIDAPTPAVEPIPPVVLAELHQPPTSRAETPANTPPLLTPDIPTPIIDSTADSASAQGPNDEALLPGQPAGEPTEPGLYVLGTVYALGLDPETNEPVKHSAVTRQGVRKPVKAMMALATSNGVTQNEWEEKILQVTPQNRRQLRTQIRKMMGGNDPIRRDARGLLVVDTFCDWKEFNRLVGHVPESATTEALTAAVQLIRGAPFEDVPDEDYSWRSVQLLKDELIDRCSTAAAELAQRQQAAGAHEAAYQTARLGLRVYAQREDLWLVAANSVSDTERKALIWDLKHAIPVPSHPELRQLLAASRAS